MAPELEQRDQLDQQDELERMLDERAIRRVLLDYCRGIDRCDAELVASVYHPDATDDHGMFRGSGADFARFATDRLRVACESTLHFLGDSIVDFTGRHTARTETYVLAYHRRRDADGPYLESFGGRYVDRMERRDGRWRIADRVCIREWDKVERFEPAFPEGTFAEGRRDRTDLCYGQAG